MSNTVEDQLRKMVERELSFHEQEFLRMMRLCFHNNIPHGWMLHAVALEWADKKGGELARTDAVKKELGSRIARILAKARSSEKP